METPLFKLSREAAADLSTKQFTFVKLDSNGKAAAVAGTTDVPVGILQNDPSAAGRAAEIMVSGVSEIIAGGALTAGNQVSTDASGRAVAVTAGTDTTRYVVGHVLIGCSNSGERATVLFNCMNPGRAA
jgi:hypothetical protein